MLWVSLHLIWYWLLACCKLPLLGLIMSLVYLISPRVLSWRSVGFFQRLFWHLMKWSYGVFFFQFVFMVDYKLIFRMFNHRYISGIKPTDHGRWSFWCVLGFGCTSILLSIFTALFMSKICLLLSSLLKYLCACVSVKIWLQEMN